MKLYRFTVGHDEKFYPFSSEKEAYENRAKVDHTFTWLPVVIEEIKIPGYRILVESESAAPNFDEMGREALKQWLKDNNHEFTPQWGEDKLREHAKSLV